MSPPIKQIYPNKNLLKKKNIRKINREPKGEATKLMQERKIKNY
jgi:predicted metallo-beta-lactamase superfamily hydrolase